VNLYGAGETGPGLLLPNGNAFFLGASGQTAIYIPSPLGGTNLGTWARGPNIPNGWVSCDAPASMMPNGKILCAIGSVAGNGTSPPPTAFCEFDYTDTNQSPYGSFYLTSSPRDPTIGSGFADNNGSYYFAFVNLPDGTILCSTYTDTLYIYQPDGTPLPAGKPVIQGVSWNGAAGLHLTGIQLNGISSGSAFGDENPTSSAYPLARFLDGSGNELFYGRTYNWSTAGIRTGSQIVTTEVDLGFQPGFLTGYFWDRSSVGFASVQVVANGIASDPYPFPVPGFVWVNFNVNTFTNIPLGTRAHPYTTLADGTYAVPSHGVIAIDSSTQPSSSLETMTISKPMTIISAYGPATIGH
jgi:hypothetical protein